MCANVGKNEQRGNYRKYFVAIILYVQLLSNDKKKLLLDVIVDVYYFS